MSNTHNDDSEHDTKQDVTPHTWRAALVSIITTTVTCTALVLITKIIADAISR